MRANKILAASMITLAFACPAAGVFAQTKSSQPQTITSARGQSRDVEIGMKNGQQPMGLDTRRHLSDMSVEVIDACMNLSSAQREQIQAILDLKHAAYQALTLAPDQQTDPAAVTNLWKQRAEISRQASRNIAMTLTREQQNQIARLMTEQADRATAGNSDTRLSQNLRSNRGTSSRPFHLHRQLRPVADEKP